MAGLYSVKKGALKVQHSVPRYTEFISAYLPSRAIVSFRQQRGTPAQPLVARGQRVEEGQLIGEGSDKSVNVHAPIPGIIRDFYETLMPDGKKELAAIIDLEGHFTLLGKKQENLPWKFLSPMEIIRLIEEKGVINTFGIPLPLAECVRDCRKKNATVLLVRLFDEDPTYETDGFISRLCVSQVVQGAAITAKAMGASSVLFLYDTKDWIGPDQEEIQQQFTDGQVRFISVHNSLYPNGNQRELINAVNKPARKKDKPEITYNDLMIDAVTAVSVFDAIVRNVPVLERYVHVSGPALVRPGMFKIRIGTRIGDIIEECGGFCTDPAKIIVNGLMLGQAIYNMDTPITKYTKSVCVLNKDSFSEYASAACVRCGNCISACPAGIHPLKLYQDYVFGNPADSFAESALCEECNACSSVCPSRIPLSQVIRRMKYIGREEKN